MTEVSARYRTSAAYIQVLRAYLGNRYSEHTVNAFTGQAGQFLAHVGAKPSYTRQDVLSFIDLLIAKGYKGRSITTILTGVRAMFRANNLTWPLDRADMHLGLPEQTANTPLLSHADVERLIQGARQARFPDIQVVLLSTLFGFRNAELGKILSTGCDGRHVEVQTAKLGRRRRHIIPAQLSPLLTFKGHSLGRDGAHKVFDRMMVRYVRPPREQEGWHSLRRSLVTELVETGLTEYMLTYFMGWKKAQTAFQYFHPDPAHVDREVYKVHPYLPLWLNGQQPIYHNL